MKYIFIFILKFALSACNYADIPGMFITEISVNERFEQSLNYNNLKSPVEIISQKNDYLITVAADAHIGKTNNFDVYILKSKALNAEAMVLNGDMCNGNDYDYNLLEKQLPVWSEQKYFLIAGNHELYFDGWKHFYNKFGSSSYYFSVKTNTNSDLFICLDSGSGTLGSKQLKWLKKVFESKRNEFRHCIVFSHNNIHRIRKTGSTNPVVNEIMVLTDLFIKHRVNMVIMGHDHVRNVINFGNTKYITMDALLDANKNASFLKILISENKIEHEFVAI